MENKDKIIMYDSEEAASLKSITGWVSSTGQYWGKDEHMARYAGSTHKNCECGRGIHMKHYTCCDTCIAERSRKRYLELPYQEYNGTFPLAEMDGDKYFWDEDDLIQYFEDLTEDDQDPLDYIDLVHCAPQYASQIGMDHWEDITPEDHEEIGTKEFQEKLDELNKIITDMPPVSWMPGKIRTTYYYHKS